MDLIEAGRMKLWVLFEIVFLALLLSGSRLAIAQNAGQCGSISTNNLVASVGSSHNITCSFCGKGAADEVEWNYGGKLLPASHYTEVNSSASMVTLLNLGLTSRKGEILMCISEEESYTTLIKIGFPPDAPRDLECVTRNFNTLICSWNPGRDTNIETHYTACSRSPRECTEVGTNNFVERDFFVFSDLLLQITAINVLGTQKSEEFRMTESDFAFGLQVFGRSLSRLLFENSLLYSVKDKSSFILGAFQLTLPSPTQRGNLIETYKLLTGLDRHGGCS